METNLARKRIFSAYCTLLLTACIGLATLSTQASAQGDKPAGDKPAADKSAPDKNTLPPLPPDAHAEQTIQLDGKPLKYTVTVGTLPVRDKDGKVSG